jgi:hypothetical protein
MLLVLIDSERRYIENSTIASRGAGGGITAWKGTPDGYAGVYNNTYGLYVHNSQLVKVRVRYLEKNWLYVDTKRMVFPSRLMQTLPWTL